jgi:hypothetical protein
MMRFRALGAPGLDSETWDTTGFRRKIDYSAGVAPSTIVAPMAKALEQGSVQMIWVEAHRFPQRFYRGRRIPWKWD